jgi:hypothetical protein
MLFYEGIRLLTQYRHILKNANFNINFAVRLPRILKLQIPDQQYCYQIKAKIIPDCMLKWWNSFNARNRLIRKIRTLRFFFTKHEILKTRETEIIFPLLVKCVFTVVVHLVLISSGCYFNCFVQQIWVDVKRSREKRVIYVSYNWNLCDNLLIFNYLCINSEIL